MALVEVLGFGFIILVIAVFVLNLLFPYHFVSNQTHQLINKIPGPPLLFAFGNTWEFFLEPEEFFSKMLELHGRYPEIFRIWILGKPTVVLVNPKDIEVILNSTKHIDKSHHYTFLHDWLGLGLLTSTGIKWHNRRKMLTPAFHFKILEEHVPTLNQITNILTQKLMACTIDDTPVDIHKFITLCSLDIICETAMGISVGAQEGHHDDYAHTIKRMTRLLRHRQTHVWIWRPFTFGLSPSGREHNKCVKVVHNFTEKVIRERRVEYRANAKKGEDKTTDKKRLAFLDLLIALSEKDGSLSDADIREEVDTFMFEGHDTVSTAITWALYLIGIHKDIQDKLVEELDDIFHGSDRPATWNDLNNMKYMEMTIKEALRMYPSVPVFARETTSVVQLEKYTIPKGVEFFFFPYVIHRNPEVFPEPNKFNPDNFLPDRIQSRHPFSYLPFSAGPRNCIGQRFALLEEKAIISSILRRFKLESVQPKELKILLDLILKPLDPIKIKITERL